MTRAALCRPAVGALVALAAVACAPADGGAPPAVLLQVAGDTDGAPCSAVECSFAFEVPSVVELAVPLQVVNQTGEDVVLLDVAAAGDPAFVLGAIDDVAPAGGVADVPLAVTPRPRTTLTTTVTLELSAGRRVAHIAVTGREHAAIAACDFGDVPLGQTSTCHTAIRNVGVRDLLVDAVDVLDGAGAAFGIDSVVAQQQAVPPGASLGLQLSATPSALGPFAARLRVRTDAEELDVALGGVGVP